MTLTKANIVESVHHDLQLRKSDSLQVVECLLDIIKRTLASGEDVLISGFGKFCVRDKEKRRGRNPQTGENLMLESRRVVTFRCSGILKNKVNGHERSLPC